MRHLGNVCGISGFKIEPVDIVTFGSPCQDLSIAGKRAGLKHEENGDDETTRSGLFMEAVRIIHEMREATNGEYPKFAIWENVMGAFSSNKGEDFRIVLEEFVKICEPEAIMPPVPEGGWAYADCYCGDGWSFAYRVFNAQYWGVAQRRRRCYALLDLTGERAAEILFGRDGLRGYFTENGTPWQNFACNSTEGVETDNCSSGEERYISDVDQSYSESYFVANMKPIYCLQGSMIGRADKNGPQGSGINENQCFTLNTIDHHAVCYEAFPIVYDARGNGDGRTTNTITGDHERRISDYSSVVVDSYGIGNGQANQSFMHEQAATLNCMHDQQAVCVVFDKEVYNSGENDTGGHYISEDGIASTLRATGHPPGCAVDYVVRRLTPVECARLQGFPDQWGEIDQISEWTYTDHVFWSDVRNTHAVINGKEPKEYSEKQMQAWYNKLHTDTAEYRLWGNGIALPCALYVMQGIADRSEEAHV